MSIRWMGILLAAAALAVAQQPPAQNYAEQQELAQALGDAGNSTVDIVRVLEAFLKKHPQSSRRQEVELMLARASIDNKDDWRIVLYGERVLAATPEDALLLDRVARSLLALKGRENAAKSLKYSRTFEEIINKLPSAEGHDAARRQEERDRGLARALLYQSRAQTVLAENEDALRLAAKAFAIYPGEESARQWAEALESMGRNEEAITHRAEAFVIPDSRATDAERLADRTRLGELYAKIHGSEAGMGEVIVAAYDRTQRLLEDRRKRFIALDPNFNLTDPMQFTLTGLDGKKLSLASLHGKVVVMDFWATWCQPCRTQHPLYEQVKKRFQDRADLVFLPIDADEDHTLVAPFLDAQHWSRTVYFEDGLSRLLQVTSLPTTILFDKHGRMAGRLNGFAPEHFVEQLTGRIQSALEEPRDQ